MPFSKDIPIYPVTGLPLVLVNAGRQQVVYRIFQTRFTSFVKTTLKHILVREDLCEIN